MRSQRLLRMVRRAVLMTVLPAVLAGSHATGFPLVASCCRVAEGRPPEDAPRSACREIARRLSRNPGSDVRRTDKAVVSFGPRHEAGLAGCRVESRAEVADGSAILEAIAAALRKQGWVEVIEMAADGPDGSVIGLERGGVTCRLEGRWDGGDDADPAPVAGGPVRISGACASRR